MGAIVWCQGEGLLDRVLCKIDVAEDADQRGHRASGLLAEDQADPSFIDVRHVRQPPAVSAKGQTSMGEEMSRVTSDAQLSASSKSAASMM